MTTNTDSTRKLSNLIINPDFQFKMLGYFFGLFALTTVSFYSTTFLFFWKLKKKALAVGIPDGHVFFRFLENQKSDLDLLFIGLAIFNLLLLIITGFVISHRIAGPLHKLKAFLTGMKADSEPFKLRQKDFFKDLEPTVNDLRSKLK